MMSCGSRHTYSKPREDKPLWALVADKSFAPKILLIKKGVDPRVRKNIFLQSWAASFTQEKLASVKVY